jgi:hypothetical protein
MWTGVVAPQSTLWVADLDIAPRNEIPLASETVPQECIRTLRTNDIRNELVDVVSEQQFTNLLVHHQHHSNECNIRSLDIEQKRGQTCYCSTRRRLDHQERIMHTHRAGKIKQYVVRGVCLELKLLRKGFVDGNSTWVCWVITNLGCRNHDPFTDYHCTFADTRSVPTPTDTSVKCT